MPHQRSILFALGMGAMLLVLGGATDQGGVIWLDHWLESAGALRAEQGSDAAIAFWQWISWSGGGIQRYYIVTAMVVILGAWHHWRSGVALALTAILSNITSGVLKDVFARPRPDIVPHLDFVNSLSFPSGHATNAAAVYFLFAMLVPTARRTRWLIGAAILTIATGWSRIALGVHWPSDVVGGWLLGGAFALAGYTLAQYFEGKAHWQAGQPESS